LFVKPTFPIIGKREVGSKCEVTLLYNG